MTKYSWLLIKNSFLSIRANLFDFRYNEQVNFIHQTIFNDEFGVRKDWVHVFQNLRPKHLQGFQ